MILSKARASISAHGDRCSSSTSSQPKRKSSSVPDLQLLLEARDYTGAITLLQLKHLADVSNVDVLEWLAYAHFHHGEHDKALDIYKQLLLLPDSKPIYHTYSAACLFYMGLYDDAEAAALRGPLCSLRGRILFHLAHKKKDEKASVQCQEELGPSFEDQLSLASVHYLHSNYQDATDVYKRLLLQHRDWLALNVYVALCYYNLDFHDVSLEILNAYLQAHPDSIIAANLKACNNYKLWGGKFTAADLRALKEPIRGPIENELLQHNLVVFRQGEGALQVLPCLLDIFPEARLNLVIHHLHNNELQLAYEIAIKVEPATPQEYILKAVTCASLGQEINSEDLIQQGLHYFQIVGSSASECDTVPGRQCMASFFFLNKQFEDALVYLKSIDAFCGTSDEFKWNYGLAKAVVGDYREAEEKFSQVCGEKLVNDYYYHAWLSYCLIMNGKAHVAWERYLQTKASDESFSLLQLIANECYKTGQFFYAAKAFDVLMRSDESQEHWEGLRGACVGIFERIIARKEPEENFREILILLRGSNNPQAEHISQIIQKWAKENIGSSQSPQKQFL